MSSQGQAPPPDPAAWGGAGFSRALVAGDPGLVRWIEERVQRRAAPRFSRWAWHWIGDDLTADLLAQLTVTASRPGFVLRGEPGAYVDTAIANLCRSAFRSLALVRRSPRLDDLPDLRDRTAGAVRRLAAALEVRDLLLASSPACRRLLAGKYLEGRSLEELGRDLGVSPAVARSRLHACRERLRATFSGPAGRRGNISEATDS